MTTISVKPGTKQIIKTTAKWVGGALAAGATAYAVNQAVRGPEGNVFERLGDGIVDSTGLLVAAGTVVAVGKGIQSAMQPGATVTGVIKDAAYGAVLGGGIGLAANVVANGADMMLSDTGGVAL